MSLPPVEKEEEERGRGMKEEKLEDDDLIDPSTQKSFQRGETDAKRSRASQYSVCRAQQGSREKGRERE
jgi:hypothetical protein